MYRVTFCTSLCMCACFCVEELVQVQALVSVSMRCILHPVLREIELGEYAVKPRWFDTGCVKPGSERDRESHF